MKCFAYKLAISRYLDDDLSLRERDALLEHIGECSICAATLARYRIVEVALRKIPDSQPSLAVRDRLLSRIEASKTNDLHNLLDQALQFPGWLQMPRLVAVLATLLVVSGASLLTLANYHVGVPGREDALVGTPVSAPLVSGNSIGSHPTPGLTPMAKAARAARAFELLLQQTKMERPLRLALPEYVPAGMRLERFSLQSLAQADEAQNIEVSYGAQDGKSVQIRRLVGSAQPALSDNAKRMLVSGHEWWVERRPTQSRHDAQAYILITWRHDEVIVLDAVLPLDELIRMIESIEWMEEDK